MVYVCEAQKKRLVQFLNDHPQLKHGKFSGDFTYKKAQLLWEQLSDILNSIPNGAVKNWQKWRKTWQDMKKHAKTKNAQVNRYSSGTGGGPAYKNLSEVDLEILDMITETQRDGLKIGESPLDFSFLEDDPVDSENVPTPAADYDEIITSEFDEETNSRSKNQVQTRTISLVPAEDKKRPLQDINEGQASTSMDPSADHGYSLKFPGKQRPPKRLSKTTRLQTSIQMAQTGLKSVDKRNSILGEYYRNKIVCENMKIRAQMRTHKLSTVWWKNLSMH